MSAGIWPETQSRVERDGVIMPRHCQKPQASMGTTLKRRKCVPFQTEIKRKLMKIIEQQNQHRSVKFWTGVPAERSRT